VLFPGGADDVHVNALSKLACRRARCWSIHAPPPALPRREFGSIRCTLRSISSILGCGRNAFGRGPSSSSAAAAAAAEDAPVSAAAADVSCWPDEAADGGGGDIGTSGAGGSSISR